MSLTSVPPIPFTFLRSHVCALGRGFHARPFLSLAILFVTTSGDTRNGGVSPAPIGLQTVLQIGTAQLWELNCALLSVVAMLGGRSQVPTVAKPCHNHAYFAHALIPAALFSIGTTIEVMVRRTMQCHILTPSTS